MTLREALLKYGKVKRPNFGEGHYITTNKDGYIIYENDNYITASTLSLRSFVLADDWEEYKEPILDKEEKEYLSFIIKPFRNRIMDVYKTMYEYEREDYYAIRIRLKPEFSGSTYDYLSLPYFRGNTMYKGMQADKNYTLEDLGL